MSSTQEQKTEVQGQHAIIGVASNTPAKTFTRTTHPDAQWFAEANLGLFIHWGISSVQGTGDLSWSMMAREQGHRKKAGEAYGVAAVQKTMSPRKYWEQAKRFSPDQYEPEKWLQAAKDAGCTYAVFTTKHHDGFAMWPSEHGDFSTKNYLDGRDLVQAYVEACRKVGLKVGFYYSPPDWYFNQDRMSFGYGDAKPALDIDHKPVELKKKAVGEDQFLDDQFRVYIRGQVQELLSGYGPVDLLWFDGSAMDAISIDEIRALQPHILINPRGHGVGDFATSECGFPKAKHDGWWEYCHIFNDGAWGYLKHEIYKPAGWAVSEIVKTRCWEGNFLLSVGPDADGNLPEVFFNRMKEIGAWLKRYGQTIGDVASGPWPEQCNAPVSVAKDGKWYVFLLFDQDEPVLLEDARNPQSITRLDTHEAVSWSRESDGRLKIDVSPSDRSVLVDVLQINW